MFKYWPRSRSSSEYSTTDLHLDVDATGGELESRPRLERVDLFLLRVKVSPVFSSRSSRSSSSRTSSSSRAYRYMLGFRSIKTKCTELTDDDGRKHTGTREGGRRDDASGDATRLRIKVEHQSQLTFTPTPHYPCHNYATATPGSTLVSPTPLPRLFGRCQSPPLSPQM
jgi:hypothetical protein